jgi:hypothetical protein
MAATAGPESGGRRFAGRVEEPDAIAAGTATRAARAAEDTRAGDGVEELSVHGAVAAAHRRPAPILCRGTSGHECIFALQHGFRLAGDRKWCDPPIAGKVGKCPTDTNGTKDTKDTKKDKKDKKTKRNKKN